MSNFFKVIALVSALMTPFTVTAATKEIIVNKPELQIVYEQVEDKSFLYYKGYISSGIALQLRRILMVYDTDVLVINSTGGFVRDAYIIGRHLADYNIAVVVEQDTLCMSACAMIAMASNNLTIEGKMGFHTPYITFLPIEFSLMEMIQKHNRDVTDFVNYFHENGYSHSLVNDILRQTTPSTYITFDNEQDFLAFRTNDIGVRPKKYYSLYKIEKM